MGRLKRPIKVGHLGTVETRRGHKELGTQLLVLLELEWKLWLAFKCLGGLGAWLVLLGNKTRMKESLCELLRVIREYRMHGLILT